MRRSFMSAFVVAASVGLCQLAGAESLTTADKKSIDITYYPAPAERAPVVVLIPDTRCDRSVFQKLPSQLQQAGFAVVATDLRYKALMAGTRNRAEAIRTLQSQDTYAPVRYDVKSVLDYVVQKKDVNAARA